MRGIRIPQLWVAAGAVLAAVSCGTEARSVPPPMSAVGGRPAVAVDTTTVAPSDITDAVDVVGSLAPKFTADVKSEVTGTIAEVHVTEWVSVRRGTPLARLDVGETQAALDALNALAAQARVADTRAR